MIELRDISKVYKETDSPVKAVGNVNLSIDTGCFVSIVGRSGSGKSTLLKMIGGILRPTTGEICIDGQCINDLPDKDISRLKYNKFGFVFQDYFLEESFTVYQNLEIALMVSGCKKVARKQQIENILNEVGLLDKENSLVSHLSGGEKQRLAFARLWFENPELVVLDEATSAMDNLTEENVMKSVMQKMKNKTVIAIAHRLNSIAGFDRIILFREGKIVGQGTFEELLHTDSYFMDLYNANVK